VRFHGGLAQVGTRDWIPSDKSVRGGALAWGFDLSDPVWPSPAAVAHPPSCADIESLVPVPCGLLSFGDHVLLFDVTQPRSGVRNSAAPRALVR